MNLLLLVADNLTPLRPKIDRWKASVSANGYSISEVAIGTSATIQSVGDIIRAARPGLVQLFGRIPVPQVYQGVDGHGYRAGDEDLLYAMANIAQYGQDENGAYFLPWPVPQAWVVARADFSGMPEIGDELALMGNWLDLNDAYRTGAFDYPTRGVLVDGLDYLQPEGATLTAIMEAVIGVGNVIDTRGKFAFKQFHNTYAGQNFIVGSLYDGGEPFGVGEYNTGTELDFASGKVKVCVAIVFCSNGWRFEVWPLLRAMLVGGSMAVVYGTWSPPQISEWSSTTGIGTALHDGGALFTVIGDGTLPLVLAKDFDMTQADVDEIKNDLAQLRSQMAIVVGAVAQTGGPGGGSGAGKLTINLAVYRPAGSTARSGPGTADATSAVQRLHDAGAPFWVDPTITKAVGDPALGTVKELYVEWVDASGASHSATFGQSALINLG